PDDNTPLDWADDFANEGLADDAARGQDGGQAAKLIVMVAAPIGDSTTAFNPDESGPGVDLEAILAADQPHTTWDDLEEGDPLPPFQIPLFNSYLYATLADVLTGADDVPMSV